ncbi:MAG: tRNA (adenosine(37)-N6)-threonylcarbamoyltransferase complex ATPase subunit type 1 TsaE [Anaerolineae bacterium]
MQDNTLVLISHNVSETLVIGAKLGRLLQAGDVVCLQGDLGSGKTSLTQGIGRGMNVTETINSPTFVYIHEHRTPQGTLILNHVDLYRLEQSIEALALGLTDYIYGDGITVIEWAERASDLMPKDHLWITFTILQDTQRNLLFKASGARFLALLRSLEQELRSDLSKLSAPMEEY